MLSRESQELRASAYTMATEQLSSALQKSQTDATESQKRYRAAIETITKMIPRSQWMPKEYLCVMSAYCGLVDTSEYENDDDLAVVTEIVREAVSFHHHADKDALCSDYWLKLISLLDWYLNESIKYYSQNEESITSECIRSLKSMADELSEVLQRYSSEYRHMSVQDEIAQRRLACGYYHLCSYHHTLGETDSRLRSAMRAMDLFAQMAASSTVHDVRRLAKFFEMLTVMYANDPALSEVFKVTQDFFTGNKNCYFGHLNKVVEEYRKSHSESSEQASILLTILKMIDQYHDQYSVPASTLKSELGSMYYAGKFLELMSEQKKLVEQLADIELDEVDKIIAHTSRELVMAREARAEVEAVLNKPQPAAQSKPVTQPQAQPKAAAKLIVVTQPKVATVAQDGVFKPKQGGRVSAIVKDFDLKKVTYGK